MRINKVVLYNFNSYEGVNEFDFSSGSETKNIVLIGGRNGAGKTSLFSAIKIALYGPLSFGYVGINPTYISKIKDCINSKAFQNNSVEARVQITIELMVERELREYEITREWEYTKQKLEEKYSIKSDGHILDESDTSYFQNYLQSFLPPDLFQFFLFDGEEVGSVFSTSAYNNYIKNAVYKLCGLDIFEIVRKYTNGYSGKASLVDSNSEQANYERLREQCEEIEKESSEIEKRISQYEDQLQQVETSLIEIDTAFKKAGGLSEKKKQALLKELNDNERIKTEAMTKIKLFVEGLMPFVILRDFTDNIERQLDLEEQSSIYRKVQERLVIGREDVDSICNEYRNVDEEVILGIRNYLLGKICPDGFDEERLSVHDLSKDEVRRVNAMISSVDSFDNESMIELLNSRKRALDRTMEINKIIKSAMSDEDAVKYKEKENKLLKEKEKITKQLFEDRTRLSEVKGQLTGLYQQRDQAYRNVKEHAQNKHIFELSSGLANIMESVLKNKSEYIKRQLEELIVKNLKRIYRKDNLITHIEVEEDYQFNLYQDAEYNGVDLLHLLKNLGKEAFLEEVGTKGIDLLYEQCGVSSTSDLQRELNGNPTKVFSSFKRIDLSRLSKGERQIFILSLYWAIIELSGQDIPFVIDTPYARIDANHRKEISLKFFPNISKQVIILSTDEEINKEYYSILKPYIAKEYLLMNDESQNKTTIEKRYFFGV